MKVLHVYKSYYPDEIGGVSESIRQLCLATRTSGVTHRVFTLGEKVTSEFVDGVEVYKGKKHFKLASCDFSYSAQSVFNDQVGWCDLIHYHFPWPFGDFLQLRNKNNKPYIVTYHSDIVKQRFFKTLYFPLMKKFLSGANKVVYTSENYMKTSASFRYTAEPKFSYSFRN